MVGNPVHGVLRFIRTLVAEKTAEGLTDQNLLEKFLSLRDEGAFAVLVQRHGPMALGVCWRILQDEHLAEDAFQATFLVLALKAATIRNRSSLASWLYGVATRLAHKLRTKNKRSEKPAAKKFPETTTDALKQVCGREEREILDQELQRLPEKYRLPLLLCYFEGRTHDDAALQLGWTPGKLKGLLDRGRERLRGRLVRRGVTISTAASATWLGDTALSATVPKVLAASTVQAAGNLIAGKTLATCGISTSVASLVKGGLIMGSKKILLIWVLVFLTGAVGVGAVIWARTGQDDKPPVIDNAKRFPEEQGLNNVALLAKPAPNDSKAEQANPPEDLPKPFPAYVRAAWEKAGFRAVWMAPTHVGLQYRFRPGEVEHKVSDSQLQYRVGAGEGKPAELPAFLCFHATSLKPELIENLPEPEQPFGLYFQEVRPDPEVMKKIAKLKKLESLVVTLSDTAFLKELPGLKHLQISVGHFWYLKELVGLKELQSLYLTGAKNFQGLKELAALKNLQTLSLAGLDINDAGLKELAGLKYLQTLNLQGPRRRQRENEEYKIKITGVGFKELSGLEQLHSLYLGSTKMTDAGLKEVAGLKNLETLDITYTEVTDAGLKELAGLDHLQTLEVCHLNKVTDAGLKEMAGLKQLKKLNLQNTRVTDEGLLELGKLKNLQKLDLAETEVTGIGLNKLAGLKELNLEGAQVTVRGLKDIGKLTKLETLDLSKTRVTDEGLKELVGLKKLQNLNITGTNAKGAELRKALPSLQIEEPQLKEGFKKESS